MMFLARICFLLACCCTLLRAGTVRTLDGRTLEGDVRLEENAVMVVPPKGNATRVPVENILRATWTPGAQLASGLILTDGTHLACDRFLSADDISVKFFLAGKEVTLPVDQVSRLIFSPAGHAPAPAGSLGVILANNDFFEGEFQSLSPTGRVRVSSVLFGLRDLSVRTEVAAVVFRPASRLTGANVLRLTDGTETVVQALSIKRAGIQADGKTVELKKVSEIRFGAAAQSLVDVMPSEMPGTLVDSTPAGVPAVLLGQVGDRSIAITSGSSATFTLNGGFRTLTASVGVPLTMAPSLKAGLTVVADGKEVARIAGRSSIDDPAVLNVNIADVKTLVLTSTSETPLLPAFIVLVDPLLVKSIAKE